MLQRGYEDTYYRHPICRENRFMIYLAMSCAPLRMKGVPAGAVVRRQRPAPVEAVWLPPGLGRALAAACWCLSRVYDEARRRLPFTGTKRLPCQKGVYLLSISPRFSRASGRFASVRETES